MTMLLWAAVFFFVFYSACPGRCPHCGKDL
jgi:hypothetical protein